MTNHTICIKCITFNHAPYIVDAMNSFCMQKTSFPFVAVIEDDASTDGEPKVIKQYLQEHFDLEDKAIVRNEETDDYILTFARHKENHKCFFAVYLLKYNHKSIGKAKEHYFKDFIGRAKYVSYCEGDDYWTDPNKLQMQVDFLESHPEYSMCFHDVEVKVEEGRDMSEKDKFAFLREKEYTRQDQLEMMRIVPTCSLVIRQDVFSKYPRHPKFTIGDVVVVATALTYGRIWCMANKMGVYRLVPNGWTALSDEKVCRSMFSHYQGMIESFSWYQCKRGYETFRFWAFSLLMILKEKNGCEEEFTKYAEEYKKFTKEKTLWRFWLYYFNRKIRAFLRSLLGEKFVSHFR